MAAPGGIVIACPRCLQMPSATCCRPDLPSPASSPDLSTRFSLYAHDVRGMLKEREIELDEERVDEPLQYG